MTGNFKISIIGIGAYGGRVIDVLSRKGLYGADLAVISESERETSKQKVKVNHIALGESYESELKHALKDLLLTFLCFESQDKSARVALPKIAEICKSSKTFLALVIISSDKARENLREDLPERISQSFGTIVMDNLNLDIVAYFLKNLVEGVALPNLVGLDLSEVIDLLSIKGAATLGIGNSKIESIEKATEHALKVPFLKADYKRAKGARVYAYFTGGPDMRLDDLDKAGDIIMKKFDNGTDLIWGARIEEKMKGKVTVMVLLTGLK